LSRWMMFLDVFKMIFFIGLISFGIVAILAGARKLGQKK
jgi:hypothetical protein